VCWKKWPALSQCDHYLFASKDPQFEQNRVAFYYRRTRLKDSGPQSRAQSQIAGILAFKSQKRNL
jgi:hypothetical protein